MNMTHEAIAARNAQIALTLQRVDFPAGEPASEDGIIHRSGRGGVIKTIHKICDRYAAEGKSRADVLARCEKLGIARNTALRQYQVWRDPAAAAAANKRAKARRAERKAAEKAAAAQAGKKPAKATKAKGKK